MTKRYTGLSSGPRLKLADAVPLEKPICVRISPSTVCNLKCKFCNHSLPAGQRGFPLHTMPLDRFKHAVDDIKMSFGTVKKVFLVGLGEPLTNPNIVEMVSYLSDSNVCDTIEIITNGLLLNEPLIDGLVAAGLTRLKISINGLSGDEYEQNCGIKISFDQLMHNLCYLYAHRGGTTVLIKILDYMVQTPQRKEQFFHLFEPYCDGITIENLIEGNTPIEYEKLGGKDFKLNSTMCNVARTPTEICSMPFYMLQVNEDGSVSPCCVTSQVCVGDLEKNTLREIWGGRALLSLQHDILTQSETLNPNCKNCRSKRYMVYPEDVLDGVREPLKGVLEQRLTTTMDQDVVG